MAFPSIGPFRLATKSDGKGGETWIDLVDGGLSDNIGLKTALDVVAADLGVDLEQVAERKPLPTHLASRGLVLVIDSSLDADAGLGSQSNSVPGGSDYVVHASSVELMRFSACTSLQPGEKESGKQDCIPGRPEKFWTGPDTILPSFRTSAAISYQDADVLMQLGRFMAQKHLDEIKGALKWCMASQ
jgi:hypothetical protein